MNEEKVNLRKRTTHNEDNASDYDDEERQVENDVVDVIQPERSFVFVSFLSRQIGKADTHLKLSPEFHLSTMA